MTYTTETEILMAECKDQGFNMWPMIALWRKRSRLKPEIPEIVVQGVCKEYLSRKGQIRADFPYFLRVLQAKSHDYFAKQQIKEHEAIKKEPVRLKITIG